ncbi:hypothetical protein [Chitinophaga arvensicola]|uniref:DUF1735 domain-containing protein n=1 Tax=Chitinophaga arvensicola TaxID=29529 RepID=A0A1I0SBY9_9BACT|nr:hypothetical protein [Chitinophaga arvensicola]SEW54408.1 hypothetical protein SAMN04488122_6021 [Chitinophaga arvensicola]
MKTWLYLPLLLLGFILPGCTKTTNEVVIPNQTILYELNPGDWKQDTNGMYYFVIPVPELKNVNQTDGVIVSLARYAPNSSEEPQNYELLPQVYNSQTYLVTHNAQAVEIDIKGQNGTASTPPATKVRVKIVLIPSVQ